MEALLAKLIGPLWELFKWLLTVFVGVLTWLFLRHEDSIKSLKNKVTEIYVLNAEVVTLKELDSREAKIMHKVESEHQRIIDVLERSLEEHQNKLITCNENVMSHVEVLRGDFKEAKDDIKEVRNYMMNHLERRQKERD